MLDYFHCFSYTEADAIFRTEAILMLKSQQKGHVMALICVLVWGSTFVISKGLMAFLTVLNIIIQIT